MDKVEKQFVEQAGSMGDIELLNWYRNMYHAEPCGSERKIVADAINRVLTRYNDVLSDDPVCLECRDAQRMIGCGKPSYRCYGKDQFGEMKQDIANEDEMPRTSPEWCPRRKNDYLKGVRK